MDYFTGKLTSFKRFIFKETVVTPTHRELSRFELYSEFVYNILSWKDIALTLKVFLGINFLFWVFVEWGLKLYGVVFSILFVLFIWDSYFEYKNPNGFTSPYSGGFNDFCNSLSEMLLNLLEYRKENRFSFCFTSSILFFILYVLSKSIPDYVLTYLIILGIFFIPLTFQFLPEETANAIRQGFVTLGSQTAVLAEDELMPFISNKIFDSRDPDLDSLLTDRTQDSLTNSLTSGISAMPSYLDVADERERTPSFTPVRGLSSDSESDSDSNKEIHFHSKHFNGNSSSEDENLYSKGLKFSQDVLDASREEGISGLLSQIGSTIVANVMNRGAAPSNKIHRTNSSSDSEFEIINEDEIEGK